MDMKRIEARNIAPDVHLLHHAIRNAEEGVISQIQSLNYDKDIINGRDHFGYTPLHCAAQYGRHNILNFLIDNGADPQCVTRDEKFTVLHILALKCTETLEEICAQINEENLRRISALVETCDGLLCNPLHLTCRKGNNTVLDIILKYGGQENVRKALKGENKNCETPLHEVCRFGCEVMMKKVMSAYKSSGAFLSALTRTTSTTPVHIACREGKTKLLRFLFNALRLEPNFSEIINIVDAAGKTPLHYACELEDDTIATLFIENGATIASDTFGATPLHTAARFGHQKVAKKLLESFNPAELLKKGDEDHETPLFYAVKYDQIEMVTLLLHQNANTNVVNKVLQTPLLCAADRGLFNICTVLIENKASTADTDANGKTVLHIAVEKDCVNLLKYLENLDEQAYIGILNSTDKDFNTPLHLASKRGNTASVEHLLGSKSVNLQAKNESGWTAMHYAAAKGHIKVMEILLKNSSILLTADRDGNNPLHLCCQNGHLEAVKLLLFYQTDFEAINLGCLTPLHLAVEKGHKEIVTILFTTIFEFNPVVLDALVNPTENLISPLHLAAEKGHVEIVALLFKNIYKFNPMTLDALVNSTEKWFSPLHLAIREGHVSMVEYLLNNDTLKAKINLPYKDGTTPIELAINMKQEAIVSAMMKCDQWEDALKCEWKIARKLGGKKERETTAFKELIKHMPTVAYEALDRCKIDDTSQEPNFDFIDDRHKKSQKKYSRTDKRNHPIEIMIDHKQKDLLDHYVTRSLLGDKTIKFGLLAYSAGLLFNATFLILVTSFALVSPNPQEATCAAVSSGQFGVLGSLSNFSMYNASDSCTLLSNTSDMQDLSTNVLTVDEVCANSTTIMACGLSEECGVCSQSDHVLLFRWVAAIVLYIMAILFVVFEMMQWYLQKLEYLLDYTNWIDWILILSTCIFLSSAFRQCGCSSLEQWQAGILSVFLTWIDFIIYLRYFRYFSRFGVQVLMFLEIVSTFLTIVILAIMLIVAFAIPFYMAFHVPTANYERSPFSTPFRAHLKLMAMTTGEINFDNLFRLSSEGTDNRLSEIPFPIGYFIWILFLVLMTILLSNLLTGLAIYDVNDIKIKSTFKILDLQITILLKIERVTEMYRLFKLKKEKKNKTDNSSSI